MNIKLNSARMASNSPMECGLCSNAFDEEGKCPRILPCSHCICGDCIDSLIARDSKLCPFCRKDFEGTSSKDFGRNSSLIEVIKYALHIDQSEELPLSGLKDSPTKRLEEIKKDTSDVCSQSKESLSEVEEKIKELLQYNKEMMRFLKKDIENIEKNILKPIQKLLSKYEDMHDKLKEKRASFKDSLENVEQKRTKIHRLQKKVIKAKHFKELGCMVDDVEKEKTSAQALCQKVSDALFNADTQSERNKKTYDDTKEQLNAIEEALAIINNDGEKGAIASVSAL
ncbi:hypothetical protein SK128_025329 [Halocaridina rubra]|uniref:RING-type domain-containing protein n=1 Tax=Halocaridina rubra TaxID=373956 RepID=A0AAN9A2Q6_HALRR